MFSSFRSTLRSSAARQVRQVSTESAQQKATQAAQQAQQKASQLYGSAAQTVGNALGGQYCFFRLDFVEGWAR